MLVSEGSTNWIVTLGLDPRALHCCGEFCASIPTQPPLAEGEEPDRARGTIWPRPPARFLPLFRGRLGGGILAKPHSKTAASPPPAPGRCHRRSPCRSAHAHDASRSIPSRQ